MKYNPQKIEKKWQTEWEKNGTFKDYSRKEKFYALDMFPYPSGEGLHVGHPKGYIATDVSARFQQLRGKSVLHPMGWDAFGLPAENYALKNKIHPAEAVRKNIKRFKEQLQMVGCTYDWDREINTTDPEYYRWTQWIFLQMFEKGLAYESYEPINWCPGCKTGLANEDLENGKCERCGSEIEQRPMRQWVLKMTEYADRLLADLDTEELDWEKSIVDQQKNWIGRSEGAEVQFVIRTKNLKKSVLLATNNDAKKDRVRTLFEHEGIFVDFKNLSDVGIVPIEVEENGSLEENAVKKALAYVGKTSFPILANDTSLVLEGVDLDPVRVKRNALQNEKESELSQDEIAEKMLSYYQKIIREKGGEISGYWHEVWALAEPDGTVHTQTARREVVFTETVKGEIDPYFPLRSLYRSKVTGKYHYESTDQDYVQEMRPVTEAIQSLIFPRISVFTTRVDTIFSAAFLVVAPEHVQISNLKSQISNFSEVEEYISQAKKKTTLQRTDLAKEKTGVELKGIKAINPVNGEEIAVWVADFVLGSYGTGAVFGDAHDERDFEFSKKYGIPVRESVVQQLGKKEEVIDRERKAVYGIIENKKGEVLIQQLVKRNRYLLPGGGVEEGESLEEALVREIEEETGYNDVEVKEGLSVTRAYWISRSGEKIRGEVFVYRIQLSSERRVSAQLEEDELEHEWVGKEEAFQKMQQNDETGKAVFLEPFRRYFENDFCFTDDGILVDSGEFTGLTSQEAREKITEWLEKTGNGKRQVNYKMRDWVFSRQRYWGEPIPIVHCEKCGAVGVPEKDLPVVLPDVASYEPTGTGESPLAGIAEWVNTTCPKCGGPAKRETNTMPQWAGSSWYYLAYIMRENSKFKIQNSKLFEQWLPVDLYVGGAEHATRHLLYARFWHKFLYDIGVVSTKEPFKKLVHVGLIGAADGRKMSKRWNNVINPDDVVAEFGADSLRLYEMFMGPFTQAIAWNTEGVSGVRRFLEKAWRLSEKVVQQKDEEISGAGIFIELEEGKFLFHIRDNNTMINPGRIGFFGGGREVGETVRQCAVRELREELGIQIGEDDLEWIADLSGPKKGWDSFYLLPFKHTQEWKGREWSASEGEGVTMLSSEDALKNEKLDERTRTLLELMRERKTGEILLHKTIKKVTEDIEAFRFNTAISSLMILVNRMEKESSLLTSHFSLLILLLSPFAPHIAEELWEKMGHATSIFLEKWPEWDEKLIVDETITLVVQVNGKVRDTLTVPADIAEEDAKTLALESEKVQKFIDGKPIRKTIYVKGKLVNVVV